MCVGFWSLEHPDYALVLCTNRDEYLSRPTSTAHFHSFGALDEDLSDGYVLSGRDLEAGGTWLGANRKGRIAFLTNITEPYAKYASSRGHLLAHFLNSNATNVDGERGGKAEDALSAAREITDRHENYAGFNLLLLVPAVNERGELHYEGAYVTNHGGGGGLAYRPLSADEQSCAGLSNGIDGEGTSQWPKVQVGIGRLHEILSEQSYKSENELVEQLFSLLQWRAEILPQDRSHLRNTIRVDPFPIREKAAATTTDAALADPPSSAHKSIVYATRLSTVILVRRSDRRVLFFERDVWTMDDDGSVREGDPSRQRCFEFTV